MRAARVPQCAVLLGGATTGSPDPLLPIGGRPFLAWVLRELSRFGVDEAVLLAETQDAFVATAVPALAASLPRPLRIRVARHPAGAAALGALHHARDLLDARFLLCDGRRLLAGNLAPLLAAAACDGADVLGRAAVVPSAAEDTGPWCLDRALLDHTAARLTNLAGALPRTVLEAVCIDITDRRDLPARLARPALFLDRDGVINHDHGWVGTRERFEFVPGIASAIRAACDAGWHVFVVTNQSGVARGYYTEADVASLHLWMLDALLRAGGTIDDMRTCPYHPEATLAQYRRASDWRKPGPGMILDLIRCWELDPARCVMVGDQPTDLAAARAAGIAGVLFDGGDVVRCLAEARVAIRA